MNETVANNNTVIILEYRRNLFSLVFKRRIEVTIPIIAKNKLRNIKRFPGGMRNSKTGAHIYNYSKYVLGIKDFGDKNPIDFSLHQNYPNPFNPVTTIEFELLKQGKIEIDVFNVHGKHVTNLLNDNRSIGKYSVEFNAQDLATGIYFYRIRMNKYISTKKNGFN